MGSLERNSDVDVPLSTAYNVWTQLEQFPHVTEGVEQADRYNDANL